MDWNIRLFSLGRRFIIPISFCVIGSIRLLLPLAALMLTACCSKLMSVHWILAASIVLAPVSFSSSRSADMLIDAAAISWSISVSVGMNGIDISAWYVGLFHWILLYLRNWS